jgi:hypothetical protein
MDKVVDARLGRPGLQVSTMVRQIILASFVVILPAGVQAQGRGMAMPVAHAVGVAPRMVAQVPHAGTAPAMPAPHVTVRGGASRPRTAMPVARGTRRVSSPTHFANNEIGRRTNCTSAPGFGFDEVHLAATCGPGPHGVRGGAFASPFFFPFYEGGFYMPGVPAAVDEGATAETAQPEIIDSENRDRGRRYRVAEPETAPPVEAASAGPANNEQRGLNFRLPV